MPFEVSGPTGFAPGSLTALTAAEPDIVGLSDESMLAMLESRLRDLDGQIGNITHALQERSAEAQRIGQETQYLQAVRELLGSRDYRAENGDFNRDAGLDPVAFAEFCRSFGIGDPSGWAVAHDLDGNGSLQVGELLASVSIDGTSLVGIRNPEALQTRAETLGESLRQCNSGNEQLMVKLQSTMQQRTQAVTLCTNMLKANDEARDAVVGNLR